MPLICLIIDDCALPTRRFWQPDEMSDQRWEGTTFLDELESNNGAGVSTRDRTAPTLSHRATTAGRQGNFRQESCTDAVALHICLDRSRQNCDQPHSALWLVDHESVLSATSPTNLKANASKTMPTGYPCGQVKPLPGAWPGGVYGGSSDEAVTS
jgi:hypothetical protein